MPSFHTKDEVRRDIDATRGLGHRRVPVTPLGRQAGVAMPISWIIDEAQRLRAAGETKMRFVVMIRKSSIGKRSISQSGMRFGLVLSPSDYGLFIQSTQGARGSTAGGKRLLLSQPVSTDDDSVIGYTEDIPVEPVP